MSNGAKTTEHIAHYLNPPSKIPSSKSVIENNGESCQTIGYLLSDQNEQSMFFKSYVTCLQ